MELKITEYKAPDKIECNFDELKTAIAAKCEEYSLMVYDDENIKAAKADRATLNKFKKALNDERIKREKEYMKPFNEFKTQVATLTKMIDEPLAVIDGQVKDYENRLKEEKRAAIVERFENLPKPFDGLDFQQVFDERWLNSSVTLKKAFEELEKKLLEIENNLEMLGNLPEFGFEAVQFYKQSLDVRKAVDEAQRIANIMKRKAEQAAKPEQVETVPEAETVQPKQWITFSANMTVKQAIALKQFFSDNNIEFKKA